MKYDCVIFDLDGTLADTLEDIADNTNKALGHYGFPGHEYDDYRFLVGGGQRKLVTLSLPEGARDEGTIDKCLDYLMECYSANHIVKTRLYDGMPKLLDGLVAKGVRLGVLSNKVDEITQKVCRDLLAPWPFEVVLGATDRLPRKPDPEAAWHVAREMGVEPARVCYLGDSDVDMKTALAAGFLPVGAGWGFRPAQELWDAGAAYVIDRPQELLEIV